MGLLEAVLSETIVSLAGNKSTYSIIIFHGETFSNLTNRKTLKNQVYSYVINVPLRYWNRFFVLFFLRSFRFFLCTHGNYRTRGRPKEITRVHIYAAVEKLCTTTHVNWFSFFCSFDRVFRLQKTCLLGQKPDRLPNCLTPEAGGTTPNYSGTFGLTSWIRDRSSIHTRLRVAVATTEWCWLTELRPSTTGCNRRKTILPSWWFRSVWGIPLVGPPDFPLSRQVGQRKSTALVRALRSFSRWAKIGDSSHTLTATVVAVAVDYSCDSLLLLLLR